MKFTCSRLLPLWAALALVLLPTDDKARAETKTASLSVGVSVDLRCSITTNSVAFGAYNVLGPQATNDLDFVGGILLNCSPGNSVDVRLGQGAHAEPDSTNGDPLRQMEFGTEYLTYNLYEDAARTIVWDNTPKGLAPGYTFPVTIPIYGRLPGGQIVSPGTYTDTVVATVYF